jgi:hypothetical protein
MARGARSSGAAAGAGLGYAYGGPAGGQVGGSLGGAAGGALAGNALGMPGLPGMPSMPAMSQSTGMGMATGALTGAAMGTMVMPGIGTAVGAVAGGALGAFQGSQQNKAAKAAAAQARRQQRMIDREIERRKKNVGRVQEQSGDVDSTVMAGGNVDKAVRNRSMLGGAIEGNVSAVRDAGMLGVTEGAAKVSQDTNASLSERGLVGSSLDASAKEAVLGNYLGGRADVAGAAEQTRQGGWDAIKANQLQMENAIRTGGANIGGTLVAQTALGATQQAQAGIPGQVAGNVLTNAGSMIGAYQVGEAGRAPASLPGLGTGGGKGTATGANVSTPTTKRKVA